MINSNIQPLTDIFFKVTERKLCLQAVFLTLVVDRIIIAVMKTGSTHVLFCGQKCNILTWCDKQLVCNLFLEGGWAGKHSSSKWVPPKTLESCLPSYKKKMITLADFSFSIGQFVASWSVIAWCNINTYPHVLGIYPDLSWWLITGVCFTKQPELSIIFMGELSYQSCWMTTKFHTCHDSIAVVACAKFHCDHIHEVVETGKFYFEKLISWCLVRWFLVGGGLIIMSILAY